MADNESPSIRKIANPAGLGLLGFGMTTVLLSFHNLGLYSVDSMIVSMGIFYGGIAQVIAGILEYKNGNTFGTVAFTSYGLFWLTFVGVNTAGLTGLTAGNPSSLGLFFAIWGVLTLFLFIGTLKGTRALQVVFLTLTILFFVVAIRFGTQNADVAYVAGVIGIICGGSAMYTAFGEVLNEQHGKTILPLG
ncbi:acetate uptake transporter [Candidatus Methanoplasma termitum]|nr:GPR1/FUN34/YaaH family transporter [Candidatus Methanoplasma termitum]MCL2333316.1 acetate uptake transporter [Candidatus Methanoplasma sp.]